MKRIGVALLTALALFFAGPVPVKAEWSPPSKQHCTGNEWLTHKNGHCGWRTVHRLIRLVFPDSAERIAECVSWTESRYHILATNGQYRGIYQFGRSWYAGKFNPYDPRASAFRAEAATDGGRDWHAWSWECGH